MSCIFHVTSQVSALILYRETRNPNITNIHMINVRTTAIALSFFTQIARIYFEKRMVQNLFWKQKTVERVFDILPFVIMGMTFVLTGLPWQNNVLTTGLFGLSQLNTAWSQTSKQKKIHSPSEKKEGTQMRRVASTILSFLHIFLYRQTANLQTISMQTLNIRTISISISLFTQCIRPYLQNIFFATNPYLNQKNIEILFNVFPFAILGITFLVTNLPIQVCLFATIIFGSSHLSIYKPNRIRKENTKNTLPAQPSLETLIQKKISIKKKVDNLQKQLSDSYFELAYIQSNMQKYYQNQLQVEKKWWFTHFSHLTKMLTVTKEKNRDQWEEIKKLNLNISSIADERDDLELQLQQEQEKVISLYKKIRLARKKITKKNTCITHLQQTMLHAEKRQQRVQKENIVMKKILQQADSYLSSHYSTFEMETDHNAFPGKYLFEKIRELNDTNKQLSGKLHDVSFQFVQMQQEIEDLCKEELNHQKAIHQNEIKAWREKLLFSKQENTCLLLGIRKLQRKLFSLSKRKKVIQKELSQVKSIAIRLSNKLETQKRKTQQQKIKNGSLSTAIIRKENQIGKYNKKLIEYELNRHLCFNQIQWLQDELDKAIEKEEIAKKQEEITYDKYVHSAFKAFQQEQIIFQKDEQIDKLTSLS